MPKRRIPHVDLGLLDVPGQKARNTIYRIISFERLIQLLETKKLPLLSPLKWEDPFESYWMRALYPNEIQRVDAMRRIYGLCWTFEARSDAMWRIYSSAQLGVRIRTSVDELSKQLGKSPELKGGRVFLGAVDYKTDKELVEAAATIKSNIEKGREPPDVAVAKSWLRKRRAFRHEAEMRLFFVGEKAVHNEDVLHASIDPLTLIQSINLDPRAPTSVAEALRQYLVDKHGFRSTAVNQSRLYKLPKALESAL